MDLFDPSLLTELRRIEFKTRRSINADVLGKYRSAFRGSGLVFSDLREYQPGDDIRHIHWKVTARTNRTYVKSYEEDRLLNVILAVDISNSTNFGGPKSKHQRALEFAALVAMLARQSQDALGLMLFADKVYDYLPPKRNRGVFQRILLSLLTQRELPRGTSIKNALQYLKDHQKRAALVFLISDFFSVEYEDAIKTVALKHDLIGVLLRDRQEQELPRVGIIQFEDAETGERCLIDARSSKARAALHARESERIAKLNQLFSNYGADLIELEKTGLKPLADLMARRTARMR